MVTVYKSLFQYRLAVIIALHALFSVFSLLISFLLRFDFTLGLSNYPRLFYLSLPLNVVIFLFVSGLFNLYQGIWRYVSVDDLKDIVKASSLASLIFMFMIVFSGQFTGYPRSIYILNFAFFIILNGGTRFSIRLFREAFVPAGDSVKNVLIIGAGTTGNEIAKTIKTARKKEYVPVGFIDKDKSLHNKRIQGIKVLGDIPVVKHAARKNRIHEIFIAIPQANNKTVENIT